MIICILGRQPELGMAELEALYGAAAIKPLNQQVVSVDIEPSAISQSSLGGTIKIAAPVITLSTNSWSQVVDACIDQLTSLANDLPEGKITIGLSVIGLNTNPHQLQRAGLVCKKALKATGRSVRIVPNVSPELNSAQVLHNQLTGPRGIELLLIAGDNQTHIAKTLSVQDIDDYTQRDFGRPKRDAFIGMLPPKLAQIMLNLAKAQPGDTILDPFCGTGVILTEAALRNMRLQGSDLNPRMIEYTRSNLAWLGETYRITPAITELAVADAKKHHWEQPIDHVVCETYLGQPLTALPAPDRLQKIVSECDELVRDFLVNLQKQLASGTRCCIAIPAWKTPGGFKTLPVIDDLEKIGYNQMSFLSSVNDGLMYHRANQVVARRLLVVTVK
jgi:tRNA (guanine10-N2)-dimethyltransferase